MIDGATLPFNFCGLPEERSSRKTARACIVPVPYDLTTSYLAGTRSGPRAIIEASTHLELFDDELGYETADIGIHTLPQLEQTTRGPEYMVQRVAAAIDQVVSEGLFPVMLGGEHSVTVGAVRALEKHCPSFGVLQLDAHADLRDTYEDSPFNHACVARRIHEQHPLTQVGLRSLSTPEQNYLVSSDITAFFARTIVGERAWIEACLASLPEDVYVTIDLDVFDPSCMAAVGTPEPGGLDWYSVLELLRAVAERKKVIGFDIVELCPHPHNPGPDFFAAKLCYKFLGYIFQPVLHQPGKE